MNKSEIAEKAAWDICANIVKCAGPEKAGLAIMIVSVPGITHGGHPVASFIFFLLANALFMFGGLIGGEDSQP